MDSGWGLCYHIGRRHPEIEQVWFQRDVRTYRQEARQGIVKSAIENGATHLLMLDDDMVFNADAFDKVWEAVSKHEQEDINAVGGLYFVRGLPTAPCIFRLTSQGTVPYFEYPKDALFPVDVIGFGFVLFDMRVFQRINPPWFNLGFGFGEDAAFCGRLLSAGVKLYCHTGTSIGHIHEDPKVITEADYLQVKELILNGAFNSLGPSELVQVGGPLNPSPENAHLAARPWWRPSASKRFFGTLFGGRKSYEGIGTASGHDAPTGNGHGGGTGPEALALAAAEAAAAERREAEAAEEADRGVPLSGGVI